MNDPVNEKGAQVRFVDGIGPPLSQIESDYEELLHEESAYAGQHGQCARDVLALIAEIRRLDGR